ncbi:MAG: OmpA family protein [Myxococcales bacterium]|nr:OmpA family protein [Myxococcales bacterium]
MAELDAEGAAVAEAAESAAEPGPAPLEEEQKCEEGAPEWVVTFGDMMSLLLTFFILLLSFANLEVIKYKVLSGSIMRAFGVQEVTPVFTRPQYTNVVATEFSTEFNTQTVLDGLKRVQEAEKTRTPSGRVDIEVFEDYRGVVISIGEEHMFEPGRADLRLAVWPFLDDVLGVAESNQAQIQVEAHTDSTPIHSAQFPTNDHLSAARAVAVIRYFLGTHPDFPAWRLEAVPAGATRPRWPNVTEAGREKNRRVELVFYRAPREYHPQ